MAASSCEKHIAYSTMIYVSTTIFFCKYVFHIYIYMCVINGPKTCHSFDDWDWTKSTVFQIFVERHWATTIMHLVAG